MGINSSEENLDRCIRLGSDGMFGVINVYDVAGEILAILSSIVCRDCGQHSGTPG